VARRDYDGSIGRSHNASYVPESGADGERLLDLLHGLHQHYADADGPVTLVYDAEVYCATRL
jgi:hypothetical protein